ncbi:TPA: N-6 DNA methylase [Pseudomonas aeruginosa]|uniref:N-6 DNA methylase n=1 Tax=Pseudomonas aeruginosa TaxID=287 RepID=UPI001CBD0291|nr:N-6 DNA methylase [Pseudomonas aeruginosa]HBO2993410.1 N-6 DNA methylase [Pseudomonas aeruginosa]HBO5656562.1 N-6 DNA methylase [Pseudomonas aeruginosa]HCI1863525.1 N-6 DNA methylase [Pseudomonas aeruginosa]HCI2647551.1 N-6 DNA methylase [Pseudomonas aeruginosa]
MNLNEKIYFQLADCVRHVSPMQEAAALILMFVAWWKHSKQRESAEEQRLDNQLGKSPADLWATYRQIEGIATSSIEEAPFRLTHETGRFDPLIRKVLELGTQGLLGQWTADDVAYWVADKDNAFGLAPSLADLLIGLIDQQAEGAIYTPWDFSGQLAARAQRLGHDTRLEAPATALAIQVLALAANGQWQVAASDPVKAPHYIERGQLKPFARTVAVPPMGVRYEREVVETDLFSRFTEKTSSGSVLQLQHLLAQTRGRIVVVVPNSVLFSVGAERSLRQELVERRAIEAVIALPAGLFSGSSLPGAILVLNTAQPAKQIRFINAADDQFHAQGPLKRTELKQLDLLLGLVRRSKESSAAVDISSETIRDNDFNLEVARYVLDDMARKLDQALEQLPLLKLGAHFEVTRARQHSTSTSGATVREVLASDIPEFGVTLSASKEALFDLDSPRASTYFLQPNDLLIAVKGSIGKVGIVSNPPTAGEGGWVAGQSFAVLRLKQASAYSPQALLVYLRSEMGQALLNRLAVGASQPTIQLSALKDLPIPTLSVSEMAKVSVIVEQERQIQQEIELLREKQAALGARHWTLQT